MKAPIQWAWPIQLLGTMMLAACMVVAVPVGVVYWTYRGVQWLKNSCKA